MAFKSENIADWIINLKYKDIPNKIIKIAKQQLFGMLGATFSGSTTIGGKNLLNAIRSYGAKEEATIIPSGLRTNILNAFYANAGFAMALDYDDYLGTVHTGTTTYSVPLAFGEKYDISGKEYLVSMIIGNEIEGRVGMSIFPPGEGQQQTFIHSVGAACMAGRVLGLTKEQLVNAIGISLFQVPTTIVRGFFGPQSKLLSSSIPAQIGAQAAILAKHEFTGAANIFEDPQGFLNFFAEDPIESVLDSDLGKAWLTETLTFKIYPGCAYVDAGADVTLKILQKYRERRDAELDYKEIEKITVNASILSTMMDDMSRPFINLDEIKRTQSAVALNFFLPYNIAVILIDKELTTAQLTMERIVDPEVHELMQKIEIKPDLGYSMKSSQTIDWKTIRTGISKLDLENWKMYCGCKIKIKMKDGKSYSAKQDIPIGAAGGEKYDLQKKMAQEAKYIGMSKEQIQRITKSVENLESMKIKDFVKHLVL
ncbi:MAG: MmgE/PrpD family protein [Candidatus Helarchaeota archaeon]